MNRDNRAKATELAKLPYSVTVSKDRIGDQGVYLAENPDLPGCMAQGETISQATEELKEARYEYILSLLADKRPVPLPRLQRTTTSGGTASYDTVEVSASVEADFQALLRQVTAKSDRLPISTVEEVPQ